MSTPPLTAGKTSSEFMLSLAAIGAFTALVLFDKIVLTGAMMTTLFEVLMVYIAGRAIPKTAQQLRGIGGGKELQGLTIKLVDALKEERERSGK